MNIITKEELNQGLIDVRKAYRLLYLYQRRVLDTVKYITEIIGNNLTQGYPLYSGAPPKSGGKVNLDLWAWDWLNMYMYEFLCFRNETKEQSTKFGIAIQSDTGFNDSTVKGGITKKDVELFQTPEASTTRFLFYIGKNMWKPKGFEDGTHEFLKSTGDNIVTVLGEEKLFLAKAYNLLDLINKESILTCLNDFKVFCNQNGIPEFESLLKETEQPVI